MKRACPTCAAIDCTTHPQRSGRSVNAPWSTNRNNASHKRFARAVRRRAGNKCELCGSTDRLQAHHTIPGHDDPDTGLLLCHAHHTSLDPHAR